MSLTVAQWRSRGSIDQRRLGLLRNSYPDHVMEAGDHFLDLKRCGKEFPRNVNTPVENTPWRHPASMRPQSRQEYKDLVERSSWLIFRNKLDKLRRIRQDNAVMLSGKSSANTFLTTHQLAPPVDSQQQPFTRQQISASGTAAARLPAKAGTVVSAPARRDTSFSKRTSNHGESKCASAKPTKDSGTRRKKFHRLDFSFYTDKFGAVDVVTYHPDLLKKYFNEEEKPQSSLDAECMFSRSKSLEHCIGTTSRKPSIVWPKPYPRNSRTSFYYPMHSEPATPLSTPRSLEVPVGRSISAPSGHSEKARASCFSRMKYSASKIPSAPSEIAPKSRPQRASSTRMMSAPNRLRPRNSGTPKNVTRIFSGRNTCVAVKEAPLDIVGTGVSPCRPKSAVRVRRSPSFCKYPDVQSSNDPAPPREVCIIPTNNTKETCLFPTEKLKSKPSTAISNVGEKCTCNSRSVRFSCSGNTVHEYESTEPISGDEEVFSKESPAVFGITKLSE